MPDTLYSLIFTKMYHQEKLGNRCRLLFTRCTAISKLMVVAHVHSENEYLPRALRTVTGKKGRKYLLDVWHFRVTKLLKQKGTS